MHSTQIPGNLAEGETVQEFRIPSSPFRYSASLPSDGVECFYIEETEIAGDIGCVYGPQNARREAIARLWAQAPQLLADLTDAAAQLRKYETLHRAKGTPDSREKAEVNVALAARFEATIAAAVGGAE